jgi:hypothetical protein
MIMRALSTCVLFALVAAAVGQTDYILRTPDYPTGGHWSEQELYTPFLFYSGDDHFQNGTYMGSAGGAGWSGNCSGQGTWRWDWGGQTDPPLNVIVTVQSSAQWSAAKSDGSGSCDNGYADPVVPVGTPKTIGGICSGTHYVIWNNPGQTFYLQLTPTASSYDGPCAVSTSMSVTDVLLIASGCIYDTFSNHTCMIGQYNDGTISAGSFLDPSKGSAWQLSTTGTDPLQLPPYWNGPEPAIGSAASPTNHEWSSATGEVDSDDDSVKWFAVNPGTETINASATAYAAGMPIGTVRAQTQILAYGTINSVFRLTPGTASDTGTSLVSGDPGMSMDYSTQVPTEFINGSGSGYLMMGQLTDFDQSSGVIHNTSNGWALDNTFQYNNCSAGAGYLIGGADSDTPNQPHVWGVSASANDQYNSMLVYYPPDNGVGSEYVPIVGRSWSWIASTPSPVADPVVGSVSSDPVWDFIWTQVYSNPFGR